MARQNTNTAARVCTLLAIVCLLGVACGEEALDLGAVGGEHELVVDHLRAQLRASQMQVKELSFKNAVLKSGETSSKALVFPTDDERDLGEARGFGGVGGALSTHGSFSMSAGAWERDLGEGGLENAVASGNSGYFGVSSKRIAKEKHCDEVLTTKTLTWLKLTTRRDLKKARKELRQRTTDQKLYQAQADAVTAKYTAMITIRMGADLVDKTRHNKLCKFSGPLRREAARKVTKNVMAKQVSIACAQMNHFNKEYRKLQKHIHLAGGDVPPATARRKKNPAVEAEAQSGKCKGCTIEPVHHVTDMEFTKPGANSTGLPGGGGGNESTEYELGESVHSRVRLGVQKGKKKKEKKKKKTKKKKKSNKGTNDLLKKVAGAFGKVKGKIDGALQKRMEAMHGKAPESKKLDPITAFKKAKFSYAWCGRMYDAGKQESEKKKAKKGKKDKKKADRKAKKKAKKAKKGKGKRRLGESAESASPMGKLLKCNGLKDWNGKNQPGCCGYDSNRYKASEQPDMTKQMMNLKFIIKNPGLSAARTKVKQLESQMAAYMRLDVSTSNGKFVCDRLESRGSRFGFVCAQTKGDAFYACKGKVEGYKAKGATKDTSHAFLKNVHCDSITNTKKKPCSVSKICQDNGNDKSAKGQGRLRLGCLQM